MASEESKTPEGEVQSSSSSSTSTSTSYSDSWKERVFIPTLLAGIAGGGAGLMSRHRKVDGLAKTSAPMPPISPLSPVAIAVRARELMRAARKTGPDDLLNSEIAGFGTGALLGLLQGGQIAAVRYSIIFVIAGTTADLATYRLNPLLKSYSEGNRENSQKRGGLKWPEWSPIQVLDEEAIAAKQAREQELYSQRALRKLSKEES